MADLTLHFFEEDLTFLADDSFAAELLIVALTTVLGVSVSSSVTSLIRLSNVHWLSVSCTCVGGTSVRKRMAKS